MVSGRMGARIGVISVRIARDNRGDFRRDRRDDRRNFRQDRRDDRRDFRRDRRGDRRDFRNYRQGHRPPAWDRNRHFNRHDWQRNFRADRRYRWHEYRRPHGWYYRRWEYGMTLPFFFWTQDYWINDYWQFGLQDPPYGYVWVRNGRDAMLVNVESGYILRVVYGLYY